MTLPGDVRDLAAMTRPDLLALWQELFDRPPPRSLSQPFLRRFLAFETQSRRHGGLPRQVKAAIEKGTGERPRRQARPSSPAAACCGNGTG